MLRRRTIIIFYFLVGYIFLSFGWWVMLLIRINEEAFVEKRDLIRLSYKGQAQMSMEQTSQIHDIERQRKKKIYMVIGEGVTSLIILVTMTWMMDRSLRREVKLMNQQKNFLLSVTHELRSPIASSKIALQTMLKHGQLPEEKKETLLTNSVSDMDRLQMLVENLLLAARIEDHTFRIGHDACDLTEIVEQVMDKIKETYGSSHVFVLSLQPSVMVIGDRMGLTSVITNLVENAIKYSSEGSKISINLDEENEKIVFRIADNGFGIPDAEKKKIFQKFYRVGQEETRRTKGTGLGLYIVKKILTMHRGSVMVKDNAPQGSVFEVVLPKVA